MNFHRQSRKRALRLSVIALGLLLLTVLALKSRLEGSVASAQTVTPAFKNFESPQVHPLALTPDGSRLLVLNSPDGTLSIFQLNTGTPVLTAVIPVGLEPVSVAARNNHEAWVVNWLSDSVSVVNLATGSVTRTLDVGDEPTDVVFAGAGRERAFVCVSGRSQVKVFELSDDGASPQTIEIFGKQPRALARDATGEHVYVSVFESGNQTTVVPFGQVTEGGGLPQPSPAMKSGLPAAPNTSLIVKWNGSAWADETGDTRWDKFIPNRLADIDLVEIDAGGATPAISRQVRGIGTHIGNAAFDASSRRLFVTNTESNSVVRFEPNVRGRFQSNRVSVVDFNKSEPSVAAFDLNPHINPNVAAGSDAERAQSLTLPTDIASSGDGTFYVAGMGSAKVVVLNSAGSVVGRIPVGQGPTGLALDPTRQRLFVLNRFEQTLSVVDTQSRNETSRIPIGFNPEPVSVRVGRRFLYDGNFSAHGDVSCASCHLNGHRDGLAWDLGDPQGDVQKIASFQQHPMKGPMTTQSLRDIIGVEPLHWRGDKRSLAEFNPAFVNLQGSPRMLTQEEMTQFEDFVRTLTYPPNPNENLDRTFPNPATGPNALRGSQLFQTAQLSGTTCNTCHGTFPGFGPGTERIIFSGSVLLEPQVFKVPQLRGLYQKQGMSKAPGEQLTGFGFLHDGRFENIVSFLKLPVFSFKNDDERRDIEAFIMSFDTGTPPAVGLQVTVNAANKTSAAVLARINLLLSQAAAGNCEVIIKSVIGGRPRGFLHTRDGMFQPDRQAESPVNWQTLVQAVGAGSELTVTGVVVGAGRRHGIDRDGDGTLDGDVASSTVSFQGRVVDTAGNGIGKVLITLSGTQTSVAQTDADGNYTINFVGTGGTYTVTASAPGLRFEPASQTFNSPGVNQIANFTAALIPPTGLNIVGFAQTASQYGEADGRATFTVTRTGDTSGTATVDYRTIDTDAFTLGCADAINNGGGAFARCDFSTTVGTLSFAVNETSKTITVPIIDDGHVEGAETFQLRLSNAAGTGTTLGTQNLWTVTITDNDAAGARNPIITTGAADYLFFVRQQYLDFLSREPEEGQPWTAVLNRCADVNTGPAINTDCDRIAVSAAFFGSPEFQLKGFYVFRFYKLAFNRLPQYAEIVSDMSFVAGATEAEVYARKAQLATAFTGRQEFLDAYASMTNADYVAALLNRYGLVSVRTPDPATPDGATRITLSGQNLTNRLNTGALTRAQVFRAIADSDEVSQREFNPAFVAVQYYGYLRRTPEPAGYQQNLSALQAGVSPREMINAFLNSTEYKLRFGQP